MALIRNDVAHRTARPGEPISPRGLLFVRALWSYVGGLGAGPLAGQITHDYLAGTMRIHRTTATTSDVESKLRAIDVGDTVLINGTTYAVTSVVWTSPYVTLGVTPLAVAGPDAVYPVEIRGAS